MRFMLFAGVMFATANVSPSAAAQALTWEQDAACTRIEREYVVGGYHQADNTTSLEQLYSRTPHYCTAMRARLEQRIRPMQCQAAQRRWLGNDSRDRFRGNGVIGSEPAVVRRFIATIPSHCTATRAAAEQWLERYYANHPDEARR